jgi:hypothetical protein
MSNMAANKNSRLIGKDIAGCNGDRLGCMIKKFVMQSKLIRKMNFNLDKCSLL